MDERKKGGGTEAMPLDTPGVHRRRTKAALNPFNENARSGLVGDRANTGLNGGVSLKLVRF
jgi:hypothetical protein